MLSVSTRNGWSLSATGGGVMGDHCAQEDDAAEEGESAHSVALVAGDGGTDLYFSGVGSGESCAGNESGGGERACCSAGRAKNRSR